MVFYRIKNQGKPINQAIETGSNYLNHMAAAQPFVQPRRVLEQWMNQHDRKTNVDAICRTLTDPNLNFDLLYQTSRPPRAGV